MITAPQVALRQHARVGRFGDRFLGWLTWVLLGYALLGRTFAYIGVNPLFIGEITLLFGLVALYRSKTFLYVVQYTPAKLLMGLMFWGLVTTLPHIPEHGIDALRDAVIYGYGVFMFIVAGLLIEHADRLRMLLLRYRKFIVLFLSVIWVIFIIFKGFKDSLPLLPGTNVTLVSAKGGDIMVHIAGCCVFMMVGMKRMSWKLGLILLLDLALIMVSNRGGMVSFALSLGLVMMLKPPQLKVSKVLYGFALVITIVALWNPSFNVQGNREVSLDQVWTNVKSIIGETESSALEGTKEWRLEWWGKIIDYTVFGEHFLTGKGFGVNLANSDGYQVERDEALRSPHNGHMTVLARAGVPGFVLWLSLHGVWFFQLFFAALEARRRRDYNWAGIFIFFMAYWLSFMVNGSFDVFLEGPMGGIWFWSLMGAGLGALHIYRHNPEVAWDAETDPYTGRTNNGAHLAYPAPDTGYAKVA